MGSDTISRPGKESDPEGLTPPDTTPASAASSAADRRRGDSSAPAIHTRTRSFFLTLACRGCQLKK